MELARAQYERIAPLLPRQRGNVSLPSLQAHEPAAGERGPGPRAQAPAAGADDPHPGRGPEPRQRPHQGASRRHRGAEKNGAQCIGKSRGGWNTKLHLAAADDRTAAAFAHSPGSAHDAPEGRRRLKRLARPPSRPALVMDRACEDDETRRLASDLGLTPAVPAEEQPHRSLGIRPENGPAAPRGGTPVPAAQGLPQGVLALRQARCHAPRIRRLRTGRRCTA